MLLFISTIGFSLTPVVMKLLQEEFSTPSLIFIRFLSVIIVLPWLVILFTPHTLKSFFTVKMEHLRNIFWLSIVLLGGTLSFYHSYDFINVNRALFISFMYPIVTVFMARYFIQEPIKRRDLWASLLTVIGAAFIFLKGNDLSGGALIGDLLVIASVLFNAAYVVVNRYTALREIHFRQTFWLCFFVTLLLLPFLVIGGEPLSIPPLSNTTLLLLGVLIVFSTIVPYSLYTYASRFVSSSVAGFMLLLSMVLSLFFTFGWLGESPTPDVMVGGALIVCAAIIATFSFDRLFSWRRYALYQIKNLKFIRGFLEKHDKLVH